MDDSTKTLDITPPWSDGPSPLLPVPPPGAPSPRLVWQAYQLAEQWWWEHWNQFHRAAAAHLQPRYSIQTQRKGGGDNWKPDKRFVGARLPCQLSSANDEPSASPHQLAAIAGSGRTAKYVVTDCPRLSPRLKRPARGSFYYY